MRREKIRQNISFMMAWIMIFSIFPMTSLGTSKITTNQMIKKTNQWINEQLEVKELVNEKINTGLTGIEIDISKNGKYLLEYYVMNNLKPTKIEITLNVDSDKVEVTTQIQESIGTYEDKAYRVKDVLNDRWPVGVRINDRITTELTKKIQAPYTDRGKIIGIEKEELEIRYTVDQRNSNKFILTTNGIEKGNITLFKLSYGGITNTIEVFEEMAEFKAEPIHLEGTLDSIGHITAPEQAGAKPGMKIQFKHPQEINETTLRFEDIKDGSQIPIQLNIVDYKKTDIQLNTSFAANTQNVTVTGKNEQGKKLYDSSSKLHTIYLVQEETPAIQQETIKWDALGESRVMEKVEIVIPSTSTRLNNMRFITDQKAHTYLGFWIERTNETEAVIRYIPYQGLGTSEILYTVYQDGKIVGVANNSQSNSIPIPFIREGTQEYEIEVQVFGQVIKSQVLTYEAYKDTNIPPPTPQIKGINNIYAIPALDRSKQPQAIGFDMEWTAPKRSTTGGAIEVLLDEGDLYYEVFLYEDPAIPQDGKVYSKVFKVSKNTNGKVIVEPYSGIAGRTDIDAELRYKADTDTFIMEDIKVKDEKSESNWNRLDGIPSDYKLLKDYPVTLKEVTTLSFSVPNTYYATIRAVYDKKGSIDSLTVSKESNPMPFSIDETREIIPVVSQINSQDNTSNQNSISQKITFEHTNLSRYYERMLRPANWNLWMDSNKQDDQKYRRTYEFFLYQKNEFKDYYAEKDFDFTNKEHLFIEYDPLDSNKNSIELTEVQKQALRKGEILPIKSIGLKNQGNTSIVINGLDANQVYYVQMKVKVEPWREPNEKYVEHSLLSGTHSFTTYTAPIPPSPDEQVPPTPSKFWIEEQLNNTSVTLGWLESEYVAPKDSTIYYELARVQDKELSRSQLDRRMSIDELQTINSEVVGFRSKMDFLEKRINSKMDWRILDPKQSSDRNRIQDITLAPNTIYYYYIRTVVVILGQEIYSDWIMMPVTTEPVNRPIKLKIEHPDNYKYDLKDEAVISFLAPVPQEAKIPEEYDFDIAVKGEKDEDYRLDYRTTRVTSKEDEKIVPQGYVHLVYKITGLKPGSKYEIKVRVIDKTKIKPEHTEYPKSLYSDKIQYRTEYDDEDAELDNKYEEYLKKYDSEAEKLKRQPYWEIESDKYSRVYKYRESYMQSEMSITKQYTLAAEQEIKSYYYYFPAQMLEEASKQGTMLISEIKDTSITLRPYTLGNKTREIQEAIQLINKRKIEDYYIALEIKLRSSSKSINGEIPLSPEIYIDMELVELETKDTYIEERIINELNQLIDEGRSHLITILEREVKYGEIREEKINQAIELEIEEIKEELAEEAKYILNRVIKKVESIEEIDKPILVTSKISAYGVNGYYGARNWEPIYTFKTKEGYAIEAERLGIYVFVGNHKIMVPELAGNQGFVAKYQLTEFFELDTYGIQKSATKGQVIGTLARILGAKRGTDYIAYLQNRGIKGITANQLDKPIRQDEAIYLVMQGYEKIHFKPIQAIYIKNKQSVQNIGAFQPHYRDYVYAAVELGMIKTTNNKVLPSKTMTAKEIIDMFSKIVPK
ncbi:MAG: fibronectin type III domain-containing protein [Cellulosilyticaceae bacterium]